MKHNAKNERIKHKYFVFLKEAKRLNETSIDAVAQALAKYENYTQSKDFKYFHIKQAIGFKKHLAKLINKATKKPLSKKTINSILRHLKAFFQWLSMQPGYKSSINYTDTEYLNFSEKETRIANARREKTAPTIEQIKHVIQSMKAESAIQKRNRALMAFILLTGARDSAVASFKLKHVDLDNQCVYQDAREVKTKYSKSFTTNFFPVGNEIVEIVNDWVEFLRTELLFGGDDPLFPKNAPSFKEMSHGLERQCWSTATPIRKIFKESFERAGLKYFNPHSFRDTLVLLGEKICKSPEQFKAWSQNLGHEKVLTTFTSYGEVSNERQKSIFNNFSDIHLKTKGEDQLVQELHKLLSNFDHQL